MVPTPGVGVVLVVVLACTRNGISAASGHSPAPWWTAAGTMAAGGGAAATTGVGVAGGMTATGGGGGVIAATCGTGKLRTTFATCRTGVRITDRLPHFAGRKSAMFLPGA